MEHMCITEHHKAIYLYLLKTYVLTSNSTQRGQYIGGVYGCSSYVNVQFAIKWQAFPWMSGKWVT